MTAETSGRLILGLIDRGRVMDLSLNYLPRLPRRKDFRIGCIGAGFIMRDCHLVAYRHAGFNPVAIASRNPEHARAVAEQHQIAVCHPTYAELLADKNIDEAIWLYKDPERQALLLSRTDPAQGLMLRYIPVRGLSQNGDGTISFETARWRDGLPFSIWEDAGLRITDDREPWLSAWHNEREWFTAIHRTDYSNSIVGIHEQFSRHETPALNRDEGLSTQESLLGRFRQRRRRLVEPDLFIHASNHWNFDVRGFNPGGNHGSFFRVSTHSTLMFAGGENARIPRAARIEEPYDSLDLMPTLLEFTGEANEGRPSAALAQKGFRNLPGRVIRELFQE